MPLRVSIRKPLTLVLSMSVVVVREYLCISHPQTCHIDQHARISSNPIFNLLTEDQLGDHIRCQSYKTSDYKKEKGTGISDKDIHDAA